MDDFAGKCAYSMISVEAVCEHNMEVDHHDPTIKGKKLHAYGNLFPAFSLCNNAKSGVWPKAADVARRKRFLNPCKEQDYGEHLFEDPATGEIVTDTPEGVFHLEGLDLNNEWLMKKRRQRTEDKQLLSQRAIVAKDTVSLEAKVFDTLFQRIERLGNESIPAIPPMPIGRSPL